jgi:hypothetical protein
MSTMGREADRIAARHRKDAIEQERPLDVADVADLLTDAGDDIRLLSFLTADEGIHRDGERLQRWYARLAEEVETADLYQRTIGLSAEAVAAIKAEVMAFTRVVQHLKQECRGAATTQEMRAA